MKKRHRIVYIGILLITLIPACTGARSRGSDYDREAWKSWSICNSRCESFKCMREKCQWRKTSLKEAFSLLPAHGRDMHAWIKGIFSSGHSRGQDLYIRIGETTHPIEVYGNGRRLEKRARNGIKNIYTPGYYRIRKEYISDGNNEVIFRVTPFSHGNIYSVLQNARIISETEFDINLRRDYLLFSYIPLALLISSISVLSIVFFMLLWNRRVQLLWLAITILSIYSVYLFLFFIPVEKILSEIVSMNHMVIMPFFSFVLILSIQIIYRVYLTKQNIVLLVIIMSGSIVLLMKGLLISQGAGVVLLIAVYILLIIYVFYTLHIISSIRKYQHLFLSTTVFIAFITISSIVDMVLFIINSPYAYIPVVYSSPVAIIVIAFVLVPVRFRTARLYNLLREKEENDTVITSDSEAKLEYVISFIKENYTYDISREGLATAINMNTDYFSRLFKKYTGKKINEYINELRIKEATEKLKENEESIIDIAFSVGFESLSTFNRSFKVVTGKTPKNFRKDLKSIDG